MVVLRHHHRHHHRHQEQDGHDGSVVAASEDDDDDEKEHHRFTTRHHHRRPRRSCTLTDIERRSSTPPLHHHHRNHHHHHHDHHDDNDKPPSLRHHPTLTSLERKLTDAERNLGRTLTTVEHTAERTVSEIAGLDNVDDPRPISSFLHEAAHLNFYRVHLLIFTFTPLIFSGIFYASNGPSPENQIAYVDALFMCTSAMAVTGLNSVLLASLTTWQQFIIFFLTSIGSTSFVSIIVIGIRRQFFRNKFDYMVQHDEEARNRVNQIGAEEAARAGRSYRAFDAEHPPNHSPWIAQLLGGGKMPTPSTPVTPRPSPVGSQAPTLDGDQHPSSSSAAPRPQQVAAALSNGGGGRKKKKKLERLRADMIKRVDVPVRINEMSVSGWLKEKRAGSGSGGERPTRVREEEEEDEGGGGGAGAGRGGEGSLTPPRRRRTMSDSFVDDDEHDAEAAAAAAPAESEQEEEEEEQQYERSDFPVTKPGSRPGAAAASSQMRPSASASASASADTASPPSIAFHEPTAEQRQHRAASGAEEEEDDDDDRSDDEAAASSAAPSRGRAGFAHHHPLQTIDARHEGGLSPDAARHVRAIQIDEPERPPHHRFRRNSDSAASPHRGSSHLAFGRTRTYDHPHLREITESPSPMDSPVTTTFPRPDLDFGRSRTIEFRDPSENDLRFRRNRTYAPNDPDYPWTQRRPSHLNLQHHRSDMGNRTLTRTTTVDQQAMHSGFGGFPNPLVAAAALARQKIPLLRNAVERNLTINRTTTMLSTHSRNESMSGGVRHEGTGLVKPVSYITFDAVVGRNSHFHGLTTAQQEELGGVEYRALSVLFKIVIAYWLGIQLLGVLLLAPYLTYVRRWNTIIVEAGTNATWFTFFQFFSAYSNLGMSLVDASMVPFQECYFLIIIQGLLILGGNTAFPIFLRCVIWTLSKTISRHSQLRETLQFLLDHPRRCFIYLFPAHQTWLLVFMLFLLNGIDWAAFLILDIGNTVIEAIPTGVRVIDGLFQAFAVRAAGFVIVPLAQTAPALQLLYVIMMYIAVYPIAVSIRSTNVYEEKSMGVYDEDFDDDPDEMEARFDKSHSATAYIGYHARKQLAFDLWWLALAVWLICIVERNRIGSPNWPEVTIFSLIFEIVSAYGTVGLSLGNNQNNTSLSGVLSTLSKLIICAVMIRGRHRGLPIAIDRAVLLPSDLEKHGDDTATRASADTGDTNLRMRPTRTSLSSMTAVAPQTGGGLEMVEPLTDDARYARARQNSLGSHFNGSGHSHPVGGSESVRGIDHHLAPPPEKLQESDISEKGLAASASSSSGAATTSLESGEDHKMTESPVDGQEHDRNKPGWK
ncbi:low affinity potassium transporter [Rhodotorula mucilaginosa]|uniref:Low affinity potassium transporter n=1 Tax=Rhodotorula mucilaginosa TaxID=5537 RepID=A0A9P6W572_RHOMI|nr:low affinity potassium transporter [Rhodotorula mucilaginosa]